MGATGLRVSERVSERRLFRNFQRLLEVFRGFQRFFRGSSEVFRGSLKDPLRGRFFPSQRLSPVAPNRVAP